MKKIIFYENNNKKLKFTQQYAKRLNELGIENIAIEVGKYDNADENFIKAIEQIRTEIPQLMTEKWKYHCCYQSIQAHFMQVFNSFESFAVQFWINITMANPQLLEDPSLNNIYYGIIYGYSYDEFLQVCKDKNLIVSEELQQLYHALISRRNVVNDLRNRRDINHDKYQRFCKNIGMRTSSHLPPIDGFKIVEYDETKYRAEISVQSNSHGILHEELKLMPI